MCLCRDLTWNLWQTLVNEAHWEPAGCHLGALLPRFRYKAGAVGALSSSHPAPIPLPHLRQRCQGQDQYSWPNVHIYGRASTGLRLITNTARHTHWYSHLWDFLVPFVWPLNQTCHTYTCIAATHGTLVFGCLKKRWGTWSKMKKSGGSKVPMETKNVHFLCDLLLIVQFLFN